MQTRQSEWFHWDILQGVDYCYELCPLFCPNLRMNMGLSPEQKFWEFTCPLRWKQISLLNRASVGSIFPSWTAWRCQFAKFGLASRFVWQGQWTTVVSYGCQCSVGICVDNADRSVSCAARNGGLASVRSSSLSSRVSSMLYIFLEWSLLLESFSRIWKLVCFERTHQEFFACVCNVSSCRIGIQRRHNRVAVENTPTALRQRGCSLAVIRGN